MTRSSAISIVSDYIGLMRLRFLTKVHKSTGCWFWLGYRNGQGYGVFWLPRISVGGRGRMVLAHRASWALFNGPIPDGVDVLHKCDNPGCVRTMHLFLGDDGDNARDRSSKGRGNRPMGELNPKAKLTERQVEKVKWLLENTEVTAATISNYLPVGSDAIRDIAVGKRWAHVAAKR